MRSFSCLCALALLGACGEEPVGPVAIEDVRIAEAPPPEPPPRVDDDAPRFPEEAQLRASAAGHADATPRPVRLEWPPALDDVGVTAYVVRLDGEEVARVEAAAGATTIEPTTSIDDVTLDATRTFSVVALDAAGNASGPLETSDALAPWFPARASLAVAIDDTVATLRWPAARDDVEVTGYVIRVAAEDVETLPASARRHRLTFDRSAAPRVAVIAIDAAGHRTALGSDLGAQLQAEAVSALLLGALSSERGAFVDILSEGAVSADASDVMAGARGVGRPAEGAGASLGGLSWRPGGGGLGALRGAEQGGGELRARREPPAAETRAAETPAAE
ncbi:MAG: hypothetical protein KF729_20865 [Sandaracinaceae bacterium]|nr:hypothetical protein [Sandaracinaceae bacterium]